MQRLLYEKSYFRTSEVINEILSALPDGKYASRFERDLQRFEVDLSDGKDSIYKKKGVCVILIVDTTCVKKYQDLGQDGDTIAMRMIEAINAKNLIRIKMMDFMTTVVMLEQERMKQKH